MQTHNLLDFCYPGLYEIYCDQTQCSYFGHSQNVMYRLGRHFNDLQATNHEIHELQTDWLKYGRGAFCFRILECGPEWKNKNQRLAQEQKYIAACQQRLYNTVLRIPSRSRKQWTIDGITYPSGAEAARQLGVSVSGIYRLMKQKGHVKSFFATKPISIDDQEFPSVTKAISVLGIPKSTLFRRLRSPKYPTWFYIEKTRSNDYPERE